ncbi:hypothetical protein ACH5RR_023985 [Cinchona calisaya]|uniref:DUF4283 domain-containing protein n=1 Tax=Cinchona calisaya TaxID=153742 RepID=A0ABD2ZH82_9GENT
MKIFREWDPYELSLIKLGKLFNEVYKSTNVRFWFCVPNYELDAGLLGLRIEDDINRVTGIGPFKLTWHDSNKKEETCGVGVDFNGGPCGNDEESNEAQNLDSTKHEGGIGPIENMESNGVEEEPDWLIEGFETIDD